MADNREIDTQPEGEVSTNQGGVNPETQKDLADALGEHGVDKGKIQAELMQEMIANPQINILNSLEFGKNQEGQETMRVKEAERYSNGVNYGYTMLSQKVWRKGGEYVADAPNSGGKWIKEIVKDEKTGRIGMLVVGDEGFVLGNPLIQDIGQLETNGEIYFVFKHPDTGILEVQVIKSIGGGSIRLENPFGGLSIDMEDLTQEQMDQITEMLGNIADLVGNLPPEDLDLFQRAGTKLMQNPELAKIMQRNPKALKNFLRENGVPDRLLSLMEAMAQMYTGNGPFQQ